MPDITAFIRRQTKRAQSNGVREATWSGGQEIAIWLSTHVADRVFDRGRLIWDADASITCVLDATRWDLWQDLMNRRGSDTTWQQYDWSVGSCSPEWYGNTFDPAVMPDDEHIGVVTANPFASKPADRVDVLDHTPLHQNPAVETVDYVFRDSWGCDVEGGYIDVIHPDVVTNRAWEMWNTHDLDRLVVHYMQPHIPLRARPEWSESRQSLDSFGEPDINPYGHDGKELWKELRDDERDRTEVWEAYRDNLDWGFSSAERLRDAVDVDVLYTADHGNALGEFGVWSHPPRLQIKPLRKVPWVVVDGQGNGFEHITVPEAHTDADADVNEQLAALGYR